MPEPLDPSLTVEEFKKVLTEQKNGVPGPVPALPERWRELTASQRAAIAAALMPSIKAALIATDTKEPAYSKTRDTAGKQLNVSGRTVGIAASIQRRNAVLFMAVLNGEVTVWEALRQIPDIQKRKMRPRKMDARRVAYAKRRIEEALSRVRGICRGLSEIDIELAASGLTRPELRTWVAIALQSSRQLRTFARNLKGAAKP